MKVSGCGAAKDAGAIGYGVSAKAKAEVKKIAKAMKPRKDNVSQLVDYSELGLSQ